MLAVNTLDVGSETVAHMLDGTAMKFPPNKDSVGDNAPTSKLPSFPLREHAVAVEGDVGAGKLHGLACS